jgi:hypothetical protein
MTMGDLGSGFGESLPFPIRPQDFWISKLHASINCMLQRQLPSVKYILNQGTVPPQSLISPHKVSAKRKGIPCPDSVPPLLAPS